MKFFLLCFAIFCLFTSSTSNAEKVTDDIPDASLSSFGISVSGGSIAHIFNKVLGPTLELLLRVLTTQLPNHCCYDDVLVNGVHLNIQNIKAPSNAIFFKTIVDSTTQGMQVALDFGAALDFFLRACLHTDPFGNGCTTLLGCKGDAYVRLQFSVRLNIVASANATTGQFEIDSSPTQVLVDFPNLQNSGLCNRVIEAIQQLQPDIEKNLDGIVSPIVDSVFSAITNLVPFGTLPVNDVFALQLLFTSNSGTDQFGIGASAALLPLPINATSGQIEDVQPPYKPNPVLPKPQSLLTVNDTIIFSISDALINNLIWTYLHHFQISQVPFDFQLQNGTYEAILDISKQPTLTFTDQVGTNATQLTLSEVDITINDPILDVSFVLDLSIHAALFVNDDGFLMMQLSPDDYNFQVSHVKPFYVKKPVESALETALKTYIPQVNGLLSQYKVRVSPILNAQVDILYGAGYALLDLGSISTTKFAQEMLPHILSSSFSTLSLLSCPDLSSLGAHQDNCI